VLTSKILLPVAGLSLPEESSAVLPMMRQRTKYTIKKSAKAATLAMVMAVPNVKFTTTTLDALFGLKRISMAVPCNPKIVMVV